MNNNKLQVSSRKEPCPVCGDITGKCRATEHYIDKVYESGLVVGWVRAVLCMETDAFKNQVVGEWVSTGKTVDGLWTRLLYLTPELQKLREKWGESHNNYFGSDEEIVQQQERQRQREQKATEHQERQARSLSADERHRLNSQILEQLSQNQATINDLRSRGFSDEDIERGGFKSVSKWQNLEWPVDKRLPGIGEDGRTLLISGDGYLCPIRDVQGRIVAMQVRLHAPEDGNKYRWLSSKAQTLALADEMENPLAVHMPEDPNAISSYQIGLCEGVGAKPFLASKRMEIPYIGAAGGLHGSSPQLLKKYLEQLEQRLKNILGLQSNVGKPQILIAADGGATKNKHVVQQYKRTIELLHEWGYQTRFIWWGQTEKSDGDIDQITKQQILSSSLISSQEFFTIASLGVKNAEAKKQQQQKILETEQQFQRLSAIRDKLTRITHTPYKVIDVPTLEGVLPSLIEPGTANVIHSTTGSGKTRGSKPIIDQCHACAAWHNRLALAQSNAIDMGISFKSQKSGNLSSTKKIAGCSPSMVSYNPQHLKDKGVVFIDECDQVADFNFSSICNRDGIRPLILSALENQIECALFGGGNLLALSADVTQKELDYFQALTPEGIPFRYIFNQYKSPRGIIYLDNSASPEALVDQLIQKLKRGERCFVLDDLKNGIRGCKSISEYIRKNVPEIADGIMEVVLEVHADSADDPRVKAFRNAANEESKQYLCIICSPSIVSGISITNQLFVDGVFVFAQGILTDRAIKQFINRIRGAREIYMWVAEEGFPSPVISHDLFDPEEIKNYFQRNYAANAKHIVSLRADYEPMTDEWHSPHFELYCKNLSYHNCTMKYLRRFTVEHLESEGYTIIETEFIVEGGIQQVQDQMKFIWGKIEMAQALAIAQARFLSESEMETLRHADSIPPELLAAYKKTQLRETFGEKLIQATTFEHKGTHQKLEGYAAMALKNSNGEYARQLDNFYLLTQDESESVARDYAAEARQLKYGERFPGDIRWNTRKRKCREWMGLKEFLKIGTWWEPQDYQHIAQRAKSRSRDVKDTFNITVDHIHDNQIFDGLIRGVGLKLKTKAVKGEKWKLRAIDEQSWNYAQMYVEYKLSLKPHPEVAKSQMSIEDSIAGFVELLAEVEDKGTYESLIAGIDQKIIDGAWQLLSPEVCERISGFYLEPVQLTLDNIATNAINISTVSTDDTTNAITVNEELAATRDVEAIIATQDEHVQMLVEYLPQCDDGEMVRSLISPIKDPKIIVDGLKFLSAEIRSLIFVFCEELKMLFSRYSTIPSG
jgi:hypothetical protein